MLLGISNERIQIPFMFETVDFRDLAQSLLEMVEHILWKLKNIFSDIPTILGITSPQPANSWAESYNGAHSNILETTAAPKTGEISRSWWMCVAWCKSNMLHAATRLSATATVKTSALQVCSTTPCRHDATTRRTVIWVCAVSPAAILRYVGALMWRHLENNHVIFEEWRGKGRKIYVCGKIVEG
jgi:hypothetical protein